MTIYFKTKTGIDRVAEEYRNNYPHYNIEWGTIICDCGKTPGYTISNPDNNETVIILGWCGSCYRNSSEEFRGE